MIAVATACLMALAGTASAQSKPGGWKFTVYPVLAWVPTNIGIDVNVPRDIAGGGGNTGGGNDTERASIVDSRFDGAFLGAFSATNGTWRVDTDFVWLAVGGDRPDLPNLEVDADLIYGHGSLGYSVYKDLFVTAGIRRLALKYTISIADLPEFERKPGLWNPLVGLGYHHEGEKLEVHAGLDVGGFGAGAEIDFGLMGRLDWKPFRHFGLTAGYSYRHLEFEDEVAGKTLKVTQSMSGPVAGIGIYF